MDPKILLQKMRASLGAGSWTALGELGSGEGGDPFKVLIGTILSHRTRDERTAEATRRLFGRFNGPEDLARANPEEVLELIRGVGFYNVKSKRIIEVAKIIRDQYGGKVPDTIEELLKIPSVGRKTANCVLVYGYGIGAIPVDTHVHRVSNRIGIVHTKKPDETEERLEEFFPREDWIEVNDLFVRFGKAICRPIGPRHDMCLLTGECEYYRSMKEVDKEEIQKKGKGKENRGTDG
jgi:endonuclease-3